MREVEAGEVLVSEEGEEMVVRSVGREGVVVREESGEQWEMSWEEVEECQAQWM